MSAAVIYLFSIIIVLGKAFIFFLKKNTFSLIAGTGWTRLVCLTSKTRVWCFNFIYMLTMWLILNLHHFQDLKIEMNYINGVLQWLCSQFFNVENAFFFSH